MKKLLIGLVLFTVIQSLQSQIITTVAGSDTIGYYGDGGLATKSALLGASGVAIDGRGNFYIADENNNKVRKVDQNGIITTIAGVGPTGFGGDGGPASLAYLYHPRDVKVDTAGNIYIADQLNSRIRKVGTDGIITTIAGGFETRDDYTGDGGAAIKSVLELPTGIAIDAGQNIYIAEGSGTIRKIDKNGIITTIAGKRYIYGYSGDGGAATEAVLSFPYGIATDTAGNVFFADGQKDCVRKISIDGIITTIAGGNGSGFSGDGGPGQLAQLDNPEGLFVDKHGNIFICDGWNNRIRKVDQNKIITTVAGSFSDGFSGGFTGDDGLATKAKFREPSGVSVDSSGNIYVADFRNRRIRKITYSFSNVPTFNTISAGDWDDSSIWEGGAVPPAVSNVAIHHNVNITQDKLCYSLKIDGGANVILAEGKNLTIFH